MFRRNISWVDFINEIKQRSVGTFGKADAPFEAYFKTKVCIQ